MSAALRFKSSTYTEALRKMALASRAVLQRISSAKFKDKNLSSHKATRHKDLTWERRAPARHSEESRQDVAVPIRKKPLKIKFAHSSFL